MTLREVLDHYGNAYAIGKTKHFTFGAPYYWIRLGYIPIKTQMRIEHLTGGRLRADLEHCKREG